MNRPVIHASIDPILPPLARRMLAALALGVTLGIASAAAGPEPARAAAVPAAVADVLPVAPQYVKHYKACSKLACFMMTCVYDDRTHELIQCTIEWLSPPPSPRNPGGPSLP